MIIFLPTNFTRKESLIILLGGLTLGAIAVAVSYINRYKSEVFQMELKIFSSSFSDLIFDGRIDKLRYVRHVDRKELIELKKHQDFSPFNNSRFLNSFIDGIESIMIPADVNYGLCAVLSTNYGKIREGIVCETFLSEALDNLLEVNHMCNKNKLNDILSDHQRMMFCHPEISNYNYWDLPYILPFIKLYFLYLYSLENPESARNLDGRDFYRFKVPSKYYYRSGDFFYPIHNYYM